MLVNLYTPKTNTYPTINPSFRSFNFRKPLLSDIFVRTTKPDLLTQPKQKVFEAIFASMKSKKNWLGRGGEANVWKIKGTDYCVRIPISREGSITDNFDTHITKKDKVNHTLVKLGAGATIMPIIKGYTYFMKKNVDSKVAKMIEKMPVESFETLIKQITDAEYNENLLFDPGYKNIIINPDNKTMTAIDFRKDEWGELKNNILPKIYSSLKAPDVTTIKQDKTYIGKLILATLSLIDKEAKIPVAKYGLGKIIYNILSFDNISNLQDLNILETQISNLETLPQEQHTGLLKALKTLAKQLLDC